MIKLPILRPRKIIKKLKQLGFEEDHITGSHVILYNPKTKRRAVVPFHIKDLPIGTLAAILQESGISREAFIKA